MSAFQDRSAMCLLLVDTRSGASAMVSPAARRISPYWPRRTGQVGRHFRDNDWRQLVRRQWHGERGQFQRAHRILINCEYHKARARVEELIDVIEVEYALHQRRSLQLFRRITEGSYRVDR